MASAQAAADKHPAPSEHRDAPLDQLEDQVNRAFRAAYAHGRKATLARTDPIILVEGDTLVLIHRGGRKTAPALPTAYTAVKGVSHVPLAVYVLLAPQEEGKLSESSTARLREFRPNVVTAQKLVDQIEVLHPTIDRQRAILGQTLAYLDQVIASQSYDRKELLAFTLGVGPLVLANARDAAKAQLDHTNQVVQEWRLNFSDAEWQKVHVVIMGAQMPRNGNLAVQYFAKLLGEKGECARIIYAESLWDEARALDLLGTHILDTGIGKAFFADPGYMLRDLLANPARDYLEQLKLTP